MINDLEREIENSCTDFGLKNIWTLCWQHERSWISIINYAIVPSQRLSKLTSTFSNRIPRFSTTNMLAKRGLRVALKKQAENGSNLDDWYATRVPTYYRNGSANRGIFAAVSNPRQVIRFLVVGSSTDILSQALNCTVFECPYWWHFPIVYSSALN